MRRRRNTVRAAQISFCVGSIGCVFAILVLSLIECTPAICRDTRSARQIAIERYPFPPADKMVSPWLDKVDAAEVQLKAEIARRCPRPYFTLAH